MSNFVILNGFDRSGTSAISKTLSYHPKTELIMQPFNSGFIRKKMYEVFGDIESKEVEEARIFFNNLLEKKINNELIKSEWHFKFSSTQNYVPEKLHIIKTTINHLAQKWMKENFLDIHVWGIWREPKEIVSSIMQNNFYNEWYKEAVISLKKTIRSVDFLKENYFHLIEFLDTDVKRTSFLIAVRTHFFLYYLDSDKLIDYSIFVKDANRGLQFFCDFYKLNDFDFNKYSKNDLNIVGKSYKSSRKFFFSESELAFMNTIFKNINNLKKEKFIYDKIS